MLHQKSKVATILRGGKLQKSLRQKLGRKYHRRQSVLEGWKALRNWLCDHHMQTCQCKTLHWRRNATVLSAANTDKGPSELISTAKRFAQLKWRGPQYRYRKSWDREWIPIVPKLQRPHPRKQISLSSNDFFANLKLVVTTDLTAKSTQQSVGEAFSQESQVL